jgi:hypothetical protein
MVRTTAFVAAQLPDAVPEATMLRSWLDSWAGVGHVTEAMHAQGYNARLRQSPFLWWAEFCRDEVNPATRRIGRGFDVPQASAHQQPGPQSVAEFPLTAERRLLLKRQGQLVESANMGQRVKT